MRKLMLIVVVILGMASAQAQDLSVSGGYVHAIEHIGDDIKEGASIKVAFDYDLFQDHAFYFGPSISITGFTNLVTTSEGQVYEELEPHTLLAAGLTTGFTSGKFTYKSGLSANADNPRPTEGYKFSERLVLNNALEYTISKDGHLGLRLGHDYFFNQYLYHYTHQTTLGLVLKF